LCLYFRQSITSDANIHWLRSDLKEAYYAQPHVKINWLGVLPEAKRLGVATEMLRAAEKRLRIQGVPWLFSAIVSAPVTNIASLLFHEKHGFERIALTEPVEIWGLAGFQNLHYVKQLLP